MAQLSDTQVYLDSAFKGDKDLNFDYSKCNFNLFI